MTNYLFIDTSNFIFFRYYGLKKYFEFQNKIKSDNEDLKYNQDFINKFADFDSKLNEIIKKLKINNPKIYFICDCARKDIWRNNLHNNYKSHRIKNNDIKFYFEYFYNNIINNYNFIKLENLEADDIIGTITKYLIENNNYENIYIITNDNDYLQLNYNNNIHLYNYSCKNLKDKSLGSREIDLYTKIIMGDKSDNILPIHNKCGIKTALKYIENNELLKNKFNSDKQILEKYLLNEKLINFDFIPEELKNKIINFWIKYNN
jgi:5'-3' exonuclease